MKQYHETKNTSIHESVSLNVKIGNSRKNTNTEFSKKVNKHYDPYYPVQEMGKVMGKMLLGVKALFMIGGLLWICLILYWLM